MNRLTRGIRATALAAALIGMVFPLNADAKGGKGHAPAHHAMARPHPQAPKPHPAPKPHNPKPHPAPKPHNPKPQQASRPHMPRPQAAKAPATRQAKASAPKTHRARTSARHVRRGRTRRPRGNYSHSNRNAMANQTTRAVLAKLRSAHATLGRISHTYQGHRTKAQGAVSTAIRQLSHRSGSRRFLASSGTIRRTSLTARNRTATAGKARTMTQSQADAQLRTALRTVQAAHTHLTSYGSTSSHRRARGYTQKALGEMNTALRVR